MMRARGREETVFFFFFTEVNVGIFGEIKHHKDACASYKKPIERNSKNFL